MAIYVAVQRNERNQVVFNCRHRHSSLINAVRCSNNWLSGGLVTQVEFAAHDQSLYGTLVDQDIVDEIRDELLDNRE